jgi:hypothetical protein
VDNLGTWRTFFKISDGPILTSPTPAIVVKEPLVVAIFLLLGMANMWKKHSVSGSFGW